MTDVILDLDGMPDWYVDLDVPRNVDGSYIFPVEPLAVSVPLPSPLPTKKTSLDLFPDTISSSIPDSISSNSSSSFANRYRLKPALAVVAFLLLFTFAYSSLLPSSSRGLKRSYDDYASVKVLEDGAIYNPVTATWEVPPSQIYDAVNGVWLDD